MYYTNIPNTSLKVSILGLGSMTFGKQNNESEANMQLDIATTEFGINLIDTAEIYPVPSNIKTNGLTETYIGNWLKKSKKRSKIILATKISGPPHSINTNIRNEQSLNNKNIELALEQSLRRLNTDYIDLYQIHWPQRTTNIFGKLNYQYTSELITVSILETLESLNKQIQNGKIRYIGISNETPWGVMRYLHLAKVYNLTRIITIQNPYNLLNRSFEIGLAEISQFEGLQLIAYSGLASGTLTGKYLRKTPPLNARNILFKKHFTRYSSKHSEQAIAKYVSLAKSYNLKPNQMALAFIRKQPFVACILLGATSIEQLKENVNSLNINLEPSVLTSINEIHKQFTIPSP